MKEVDDFIRGKFQVDCGEIRLSRDGAHPIDVAGPGHLGQDENGNITYAIHLSPDGIQALLDEINRPRQPGALIPEDEYIQFTARAYNNPIWNAVIPSSGLKPGTQGDGVAHGTIHRLLNRFPRPEPGESTSARLVMRDTIHFPATEYSEITVVREGRTHSQKRSRDYSTFQSGADNFVLMQGAHGTELLCRFPDNGVDQFRHVRIQEALQFALGQFLNPCVVEITSAEWLDTELRSIGSRRRHESRQEPPLSFRSDPTRSEVYDIAAAYYEAIRTHTIEDWHPLSSHVYFLIEAGSTAIELQALGLSVATEGIAGTSFPDLAPVAPSFLEEIARLQEQLTSLEISETLRARISGALDAMKEVRNSDNIREFVSQNSLAQRLFKSWQKLRNSSAHGSQFDSSKVAKTLVRRNDVLYLAYAMILKYIGYQGMRTDYSLAGFPDIVPASDPLPSPTELS